MSLYEIDPTTGAKGSKIAGYDTYDDTAIRVQLATKQSKTLENTVEGQTTVEGALTALSNKSVQVDGTTIEKSQQGVLSAVKATQNTPGIVKGGINTTIGADGSVNVSGLGTASAKDSTDRVSPNNTALVESQSVYSAINTALSSIYTPRGDITCAELTSELLISDNVGNIYEVSDSGTTTALFLQGAGVPISAGTNVGIISAGQGRILFNLMANAFDLTSYQKIDLAQAVEGETTVEDALGALSTKKASKVSSATNGNFAGLDASGNLTDSGKKPSDFQTALTFDDAPTENSNNPVKSGGVYSANQNIYEVMGQMGAKNLIPYPYYRPNHYEISGITYDVSSDGVITMQTGTSTAEADYHMWLRTSANTSFHLDKGTYILSGCDMNAPNNVSLIINGKDKNGNNKNIISQTPQYPNGREFTIDDTFDLDRFGILVYCGEGVTISSALTFKPMLRLASDTDSTYQPYAKTNKELTDDAEALTNQANDMVNVLGAKNVLPFPYYAGSGTSNGVTITDNGDGSITLDGTCTGMSFFVFYGGRYSLAPTTFVKKNEDYIATLEVVSGSMAINSGTSRFVFRNYITNATSPFVDIFYEDNVIDTRSVKFTYEPTASYDTSLVWYEFNVGTTFNNWRIRPMIRLASIQDDTYVPYSMTNREITPYVQAISNPNLLDNPWFTVNQRGQSSYTNSSDSIYTVDRWRLSNTNNDGNVTVNSDKSITLTGGTSTAYLENRFEKDIFPFEFYKGKTITVSVLYGNGTLKSATKIVPTNEDTDWELATELLYDNTIGGARFYYRHANNSPLFAQIEAFSGKSVTVKAMKVELGTVSTLAMDTLPNYQQELAKCQRYFQRIKGDSTNKVRLLFGLVSTTTTIQVQLPFAGPMRISNATITYSTNGILYGKTSTTTTVASDISLDPSSSICRNCLVIGTGLTVGEIMPIYLDVGAYIDLSADL